MKNTLAALILTAFVGATYADDIGSWNFKYSYQGNRLALPVQVFDDGEKTVFQFKKGQPVPAIFAYTNNGWQHLAPTVDGTYIYVDGISSTYRLKIGSSLAVIKYEGRRTDVPKPDASNNNSITTNSYASVAKGDEFAWIVNNKQNERLIEFLPNKAKVSVNSSREFKNIVKSLEHASNISVIAYGHSLEDNELAQKRADAIINALTSFGIERNKVKITLQNSGSSKTIAGEIGARIEYWTGDRFVEKSVNTGVQTINNAQTNFIGIKPTSVLNAPVAVAGDLKGNPRMSVYSIEKFDKTILDVLQRWATKEGWTLIPVDFPYIPLENNEMVVHTGGLLDSIELVRQGLIAKGYTEVKGRSYQDKVIEIGNIKND